MGPTLSCIGQLYEMPPFVLGGGHHRLHKLYKFFPLSLPFAAFGCLRLVGLPHVVLLRPLMSASLYRCKYVVISSHFSHAVDFFASTRDDKRLLALEGVSSRCHPARALQEWDSAPICIRLDIVLSNPGISSLPRLQTQEEACAYFSEVLYPFDWIECLCHTARHTFSNIFMSHPDLRARKSYIVSLSEGSEVYSSSCLVTFTCSDRAYVYSLA